VSGLRGWPVQRTASPARTETGTSLAVPGPSSACRTPPVDPFLQWSKCILERHRTTGNGSNPYTRILVLVLRGFVEKALSRRHAVASCTRPFWTNEMPVTTPEKKPTASEKRRQRKQEWKRLSSANITTPVSPVSQQVSEECAEQTEFITPPFTPEAKRLPPIKKDRSLGVLLRVHDEKCFVFDIRRGMHCSHGRQRSPW
jgi:hypothetical protein